MKTSTAGMCVCLAVWLSAAGCGYLSNDPFFEGYGEIEGRLLAGGDPVPDALVFVQGDAGRAVRTGPTGLFGLNTVEAGQGRRLVAMWGASLGLQKGFDLAGEGRIQAGDLTLEPLGTLEGTVRLPDPSEAEVAVIGTPFVGKPDGLGRFQILVPAGRWELEVRAGGHLTQRLEEVEVAAGESRTVGEVAPRQDPGYTCTGTELRVERATQGGGGAIDILFVVDNSNSMVGEQLALATSFAHFVEVLDDGGMDYHVAVITTGMESAGCPRCTDLITVNCMNETGENGRFQDRLGENVGTLEQPDFVFETDRSCRVVERDNLSCFYDGSEGTGTALVGVNGCGYERGLAGMRTALGDLATSYNQGFLRDYARLAVILVSDEEDCGEVGDVSEGLVGVGGDICYYAARGAGPEGETVHPDDPHGRAYALTPVSDYAEFLWSLKPVPSLATFSAIVGVTDPSRPEDTRITYSLDGDRWAVDEACTTPGCTGNFCFAKPGTRYIEMARMTGGVVESICQQDFSAPMVRVAGTATGYRRIFSLLREPIDPGAIEVRVEGEAASGWRYLEAQRAIQFEESATPRPYALVEIRYEVACR